ncbi:uncharacterized protein ACNLHF_026918 [Anomaloglossus baeobatrachus]|uniref:uncharacterized protein LOC142249516 n=1 Tax=Anomaloglossus baeobatrachus TaxID=238106 RepID=UPI003F4F4AA7
MGGRWESSLLLGLLSLLSGALLPGEAQEDTSFLPTDSPVATTGRFLASASDLSASSFVPGAPDASSELPDNEIMAQTGRPSSPSSFTVGVPESEDAGGSVPTAPGDASSALPPETSDPSRLSSPVTENREVTSMDATQPPPPSAANNVTDDTATETSSLLAILRTTAAAKTAPGDDSTSSTSASTSFPSTGMSTIATSLFITSTETSTAPSSTAAPSTSAPHTTRAEVQRGPSVLEVGEDKDLTSYHSRNSSNPLFVMIVSVFTIMVLMVVVVVGFHRYKKRNSRTEFRRLQDLPMDDMMEDTPLSLYSY